MTALQNGHTVWFDPQAKAIQLHYITNQTGPYYSTVQLLSKEKSLHGFSSYNHTVLQNKQHHVINRKLLHDLLRRESQSRRDEIARQKEIEVIILHSQQWTRTSYPSSPLTAKSQPHSRPILGLLGNFTTVEQSVNTKLNIIIG